jgi:hypothetical protein
MTLNKEALIKELEESVNRLEQARSDALMMYHSSDLRFQSTDPDPEVADEIEGVEAALLVAEGRMDELAQVLGEEIDNLRGLLEKIEEDSD